jgi:hypothetical protein
METMILLKILALGDREIENGQVKPLHEVVARLRTGMAMRSTPSRRPEVPRNMDAEQDPESIDAGDGSATGAHATGGGPKR